MGAWSNCREVDLTGRYYVVVRSNLNEKISELSTPVTFEIAERKPGSLPVLPATDAVEPGGAIAANTDVKVREGDTVLGRGRMNVICPKIIVSATGLGFVCLNVLVHSPLQSRGVDPLIVVSTDGTVRPRKKITDLFSEKEISQFSHTGIGFWWYDGAWIDESRKLLIVAGSRHPHIIERIPRSIRTVDLESGVVQDGFPDVLVRALSEVSPRVMLEGGMVQDGFSDDIMRALSHGRPRVMDVMDIVLGLAAERELPSAKRDLVKIFSEGQLPLAIRIKSAIALGRLGDQRGQDLVKGIAFKKNSPGARYAVQNLPYLFGDAAGPMVWDLVKRTGDSFEYEARQAMWLVKSNTAIPLLLELLKTGPDSETARVALQCLNDRSRDAKPAIPALVKVLEVENRGRCDLRLMSSVKGVKDIPIEGKDLIILAVVDKVLHFRVFDGYGRMVVDKDERKLTEKARQIQGLGKQLESLWPPHDMSASEQVRLVAAVRSIVGSTRWGRDLVLNQRLAARALGRIGADAEVALPALTRLAERYAPTGWERARTRQPESRTSNGGEVIYSQDDFVNAICKIRLK